MLLIVLYFSFYLEITHYWNQLYEKIGLTQTTYSFRRTIRYCEQIWILNYSLIFASVLSIVNQLKITNRKLGFGSIIISFVFLFLFLTIGLYDMSELRENALGMNEINLSNIYLLRYISFVFAGITLFCLYRNKKQTFMLPVSNTINITIGYGIHFSIIWILSSELINWLDIAGYAQTYKLGLSILWGVYALLLVVLGIWKKKKHLRIGSFILLGVTLLKVCFYDLSQLNTLSKTIIFIILGIFLLIVSFLYNKYKHLIFNEK
jgi:hypothetical protein